MRILVAEDERTTRLKLKRQLEQMGHEVVDAENGLVAWQRFQEAPFPIVISDWEMPEMNGVDLVRRIRSAESDGYVYVVLLTGKSEKSDVVAGMEAGADDFISKPFDREELRARLNAGQRIVELEHHLGDANIRLRHELAVARELANAEHRKHDDSLLGESISVRALRENIARYAATDEAVLLTGPTGAGQEAVARSIHQGSERRDRPFIYVACAHLSGQSDSLFGVDGDKVDKPQLAKAALADGGTLYLEGVELLSSEAQKVLYDFLQDSTAKRESGDKPSPDIRLITSVSDRSADTHSGMLDPKLASKLGRNRLALPSLAERRDDIVEIARHILLARGLSSGKVLEGLSVEAEEKLQRYHWPGNLRELRSVIERAVLLSTGTTVDVPAELLQEGRQIGGYKLQHRIGEGGMGEVWLAQHALLARPSAVKLIRKSSFADESATREDLRERFHREAKATANLRSPHTVELYDFGITDEGDFYYVMEYLKGIDLRRLVLEYGPLPVGRAVYLMNQACMSLEEAHESGLVHRDIKPANLFVCELGTHQDFLKLLDFGIVRYTGSLDQSIDGTVGSAATIKGTPSCISPEAARGEKATSASDVYSLGCVAYTLLTGRDVFRAKGVMPLLLKHVSETPKPPSHYATDLPGELDEVVLSCLAKDPSARPSVRELRKSLDGMRLAERWDNELAIKWWAENPLQGELSEARPNPESGDQRANESSKSNQPEHPSDQDLRMWLEGALSINRTKAVESHLESCDDCADKLGNLNSADDFVDHLRNVMSDEPPDDGQRT